MYTITHTPPQKLHTALNRTLSSLSLYVKIRWAAVVETHTKSLVSAYPHYPLPTDLLKNMVAIEQDDDATVNIRSWVRQADNRTILVYSDIDGQHALIVNLPSDTPLAPATSFCEHAKLILQQILKTHST